MSNLSLPDINKLRSKGLVMNSYNFIRLFDFVCDLGTAVLELQNRPVIPEIPDIEVNAVINSDLDPNLAMPNDIFGFPAGTTIADVNGLTLTEYVEIKDFPTIEAFIGSFPSLSEDGFRTSAVEVGTTITPTMTISFIAGSIINGDLSVAGPLVGDLQSVNISSPSNPNAYVDSSVTGNSSTGTLSPHTMVLGNNQFIVSGVNLTGTTSYMDNKGGTGLVTEIESAKLDTIPNNLVLTKPAFYYRYNYLGSRGTSPSSSTTIRALTSKEFLSSTNTGSFSLTIPANTSEYTLYVPQGKVVSIIDSSTFADLTPTGIAVSVNDANGSPVPYELFTVDMGLGGFPESTIFNITII